MNPVRLCVVVLIDHEIFSLIGCINDGLAKLSFPRAVSVTTLQRGALGLHSVRRTGPGPHYQGGLCPPGETFNTSHITHNISLKCNLNCQESVAETCGLRTRDFIWKVNDVEVFNKSHAECVKMIKVSGRYRGWWWWF